VIKNAIKCVLMCRPSASNAIECDINPAAISTTIIAAVIPITMRVRQNVVRKPIVTPRPGSGITSFKNER
jgi:hypothetical protein